MVIVAIAMDRLPFAICHDFAGKANDGVLAKCCLPFYSYNSVVRWPVLIIMAALCNRAGHYIFALWFLSSSSSICLSFFFSRLISAATD